MLSRLLDQRAGRPAPDYASCCSGAAAASPELVRRALPRRVGLCPTCGLTEAASQVATRKVRRGAVNCRLHRCFRCPTSRCAASPTGDVEPDRWAKSSCGTDRNARVPERRGGDRARTLDGWLHTGDLRFGKFCGRCPHGPDRRGDLIITGGETSPVESTALLEHPSVARTGVASVPDRTSARAWWHWWYRGRHAGGRSIARRTPPCLGRPQMPA